MKSSDFFVSNYMKRELLRLLSQFADFSISARASITLETGGFSLQIIAHFYRRGLVGTYV